MASPPLSSPNGKTNSMPLAPNWCWMMSFPNPPQPFNRLRRRQLRSADFPICCIAVLPACGPSWGWRVRSFGAVPIGNTAVHEIGNLPYEDSILVDIDEPNCEPKNPHCQRQRAPKVFLLADHSDINQDHSQAVKPVQQKKQQQ